MAKYKVKFDTTLYRHSFTEVVVETKSAAKAKYKVSKIINCDFDVFIKCFYPVVKKVTNDTPLTIKEWIEKSGVEPKDVVLDKRNIGNTTYCLISEKNLEEQQNNVK